MILSGAVEERAIATCQLYELLPIVFAVLMTAAILVIQWLLGLFFSREPIFKNHQSTTKGEFR